jgi:hypothetical protein
MGESSPVKTRLSYTDTTRTPSRVWPWTRAHKSSRLRASRSILCTTTVSPLREPQQFSELWPGGLSRTPLVLDADDEIQVDAFLGEKAVLEVACKARVGGSMNALRNRTP